MGKPGRRLNEVWKWFDDGVVDERKSRSAICRGCRTSMAALVARMKTHAKECAELKKLGVDNMFQKKLKVVQAL